MPPFQETHFLDISQIRDVRTGPQARVPRDARLRELVSVGGGHQAISQKTVTVVHGTDFVNTNFLNFCTNKPEVAQVRRTRHDANLPAKFGMHLGNFLRNGTINS